MDKEKTKVPNTLSIILIIVLLLMLLSFPIVAYVGTVYIRNKDFTINNIEIQEIDMIHLMNEHQVIETNNTRLINNLSDSYIIDNKILPNHAYIYTVYIKAVRTTYTRRIISDNKNLTNDEIKTLISNGEDNQILKANKYYLGGDK